MNIPRTLSLALALILSFTYPESALAEPTANTSTDLSWSAPEGWEKQKAGMMVLETYQKTTPAGPLKLAISAFPGDVGGDLANVNRWLRQVGKESVTEATLPTAMKKEVIAGREWKIVNLAGSENGMFVAYTFSGGKSWFFKITGPTAGIATIEESFTKYLASVGAAS